MKVLILTGKVRSGKTTLIKKIAYKLDKKIKVGGFYEEPFFEGNTRKGYDITLMKEKMKMPLLRRGEGDIIPFKVMERTKKIVEDLSKNWGDCDFFVVDEIGPLEIAGKGLIEVFKEVLNYKKPTIVVVRDTILDDFKKLLEKKKVDYEVLNISTLESRLRELGYGDYL